MKKVTQFQIIVLCTLSIIACIVMGFLVRSINYLISTPTSSISSVTGDTANPKNEVQEVRSEPTPTATKVISTPPEISATNTPEHPKGEYILYAQIMDDKRKNIYISDTNGENQQLLHQGGGDIFRSSSGSFSPNGEWLFFSILSEGKQEFFVANANGNDLQKLFTFSDRSIKNVEFSNDGWSVFFEGNVERYIYNRRTEELFDLSGYESPNFSDNGKLALFEKSNEQGSDYYLFNVETGQWKNLGSYKNSSAFLAPDGSKILLSLENKETYIWSVFYTDQDQWRDLLSIDNVGYLEFFFLPDSTHFLYYQSDIAKNQIVTAYLLNLDNIEERTPLFQENYAAISDLTKGITYRTYRNAQVTIQTSAPQEKVILNVIVSNKPPKSDAYLMNADGSDLQIVEENNISIGKLIDGRNIMILMDPESIGKDTHAVLPEQRLVDMKQDVRHVFPTNSDGGNRYYILSPDGTKVLIGEIIQSETLSSNAWLYNILNGDLTQLYLDITNPINSSFSSNGKSVVYSSVNIANLGQFYGSNTTSSGKIGSISDLYLFDPETNTSKLFAENAYPLLSLYGFY